jgi:AcrR family transcriptional regulator
MDEPPFAETLIASFFRLVADKGWTRATIADAAREAGLSLAEARRRFPGKAALLLAFGRQADEAALAEAPADGAGRDRLFELLMRRFDTLQAHRAGVLALLRALPADPPAALLLSCATARSMRWMLQAAGIPTFGLRGELRTRGLCAIWVWVLRTWERDESADLSATMAALDTALRRAERAVAWLGGRPRAAEAADASEGEPPSSSNAAPAGPSDEPPAV